MKVRARDLSAIRIERVAFESAGGTVRGLFYHAQRPATCLVLCHGYSSSKHNVDPLAFYLAAENYSALAFDFLGHKLGASEGVLRAPEDLVRNAVDAVAAARKLHGVERIVLGGHSMGAATSVGAAAQSPEVAGIIVMATALNRAASADDGVLGGGLLNRSQYVDGPSHEQITAYMDRCTARIGELAPRPTLVIAASKDAIVAPSAVHALFEGAREPKTYELIEATHTDCAERARFVVLRWLKANGF